MRSNKERRKFFSCLKAIFAGRAKGSAAVVAVFVLASAGSAQKPEESPSLSVFRKDIGIVSMAAGAKAVLTFNVLALDPVAGDFDADGVLDIGTFDQTSRLFVVRLSRDRSTLAVSLPNFKGKATVVTADYDGDKRSDFGVWHAGTWQMMLSSRDYAADTAIFGVAGDVPVPADFDGDSKADLAVFRPSENRWYIRGSETGVVRTIDFGLAGSDMLLPADYTGDGKADIAVYRGSSWLWLNSETGIEERFEFGFDDALPVPADFNGDGEIDFAVFRKGIWYVYEGSRLVSYKFGGNGDIPLSTVPVRSSFFQPPDHTKKN